MKTYTVLTLGAIVIFFNMMYAQGSWTQQISGTTNYLEGVHFFDANTGTAVGRSSTILRTTDGGTNWSSQTSGTTNSFYDVQFINVNTGVAVGSGGTIVRTVNGGSTWTKLTSGTTNPLYGVYFTDANTGTIVGGSGIILRTTDGGTSWTSQSSGTANDLQGVCFTGTNTGIAVGFFGTMLQTTNGGTSWTILTSGTTMHLYGVSFSDANTGTVVGLDNTILRTTDGGSNWTRQTSGASYYFYSVSFSDANTGSAVGLSGAIFSTTNGGATWSSQTSGTTNSLTSVSVINAGTRWAVGSGGTILKYTESSSDITIDFSVSKTSGTVPLAVQFTDLTTGSPTLWKWSFGDGDTSVAQHPSHTYLTPGLYDVSLAASNSTSSKVLFKTRYITVNPPGDRYEPNDSMTLATPIQYGDSISASILPEKDLDFYKFSGAAGDSVLIEQYNAFGSLIDGRITVYNSAGTELATIDDGYTSEKLSLKLLTADTYYIRFSYWLTAAGRLSAKSAKNILKENVSSALSSTGDYLLFLNKVSSSQGQISAAFSASPLNGIAPLNVQFTDQSSGSPTVWSWQFGDGGTSTVQNPSHTYSAPGKYSVVLDASNPTSTNSLTKSDYITVLTSGSGNPGDCFLNAGILSHTDSLNRQFPAADSWQYYKIILPSDGFFEVRAFQSGTNTSVFDQFRLYDADTTNITVWGSNNNGIVSLNIFARQGMYYLRFNHNTAAQDLGYFLVTKFTPAATPSDPEPNETAKTANPLMFNGPEVSGHLGYTGNGSVDEADYWKVMIPNDGYVTVHVQMDSLDIKGNRINFDLNLYDVDSTSVIAWDQSDNDRYLKASRWLMPGVYFVRVNKATGDAGTYAIHVSLQSPSVHNDTEPNDIPSQALLLPLDQTLQGHLGYFRNQFFDDKDYWKVTLQQDGYLTVNVMMDSLDEQGNRINFDLDLYDADSTSTIAWDQSDNDRNLKASRWLMPGIYFIRVNKAGGEAGTYEIHATVQSPSALNDIEPNDVPSQAMVLPFDQTKEGHLGYFRNQKFDYIDYWKVTLPHDGFLMVDAKMDSLDEQGNRINFDLDLYDADSTSNIAWDQSDNDRHLNASRWLMSGVYFIRVSKAAGEAGTYEIRAQLKPMMSTNDPEPNDVAAQASLLPFATKNNGHLGFYGNRKTDEVDYWKLTAQNSDSVYVHVVSDSTIEIGIDIFDASGANYIPVARGNTSKSYLRAGFKPVSGTQYLVRLTRSGGNAGSYLIVANSSWLLDFTPPVPPKSFMVTAAGSGKFDLLWETNSESDIAGYKIYYAVSNAPDFNGTGANEGSSPITVGKINTFSITGLENERLYRFAMTAIDNAGNESGFSMLRFAQSGSTAMWTVQNSNTHTSLNSVSFVDQYTGWIVGDSAVALKTIDGGATWKILPMPLPKYENFYRVHFVDQNYGFAIGGTYGVCKILRTVDGGASWLSITLSVAARPVGLFFIDRMRGWVVGDGGMVLNTIDGGLTWNKVAISSTNHLNTVVFSDAMNGWISGQYGTLLNTTDGGKTWNANAGADPYKNVYMFGPIDFIDPMNGWITMENGPFLHTTNGGTTWLRDSIPTKNYMWGLDFVDAENGFAVGRGGDIFRTIDGGRTWNQEPSGVTTGLYSVTYLGRSTAWAVGANGTILKYNVNVTPQIIPVPRIISIWDIPNDNGKQVYIKWHSGRAAASSGIRSFAVWRYNRDSLLWVNVKENIQTLNDTIFTSIAPTVYDSTIVNGMHYTRFKISAHGVEPAQYSLSIPDSGYSIDNLVPAMPDSITGSIINNLLVLRWKGSKDQDLRYFSIYRDTVPNFAVKDKKPFAVTVNNQWTDSSVIKGKKYYYRIASVDWSGNRSPYSAEIAFTITSVKEDKSLPTEFALDQNYPNPFNPSTTIRFAVPTSSRVTVQIYSAIGQLVETVEDGLKETGWYSLTWQPRTSSGIYFCRIVAVSLSDPNRRFSETKKMLLIK
jgi:photosystem II stability/assembly factor-like uncharacterized protein